MIKGYFQRFLNHAFHLLTYSVRSDSPQLFFSGSRELEVTSPTLRRSHSSPAILCRLIWIYIIFRHRSSSIMCINLFNMLCVFGRIYEYGLYIMHDLSLTWDLWECKMMNVICCWMHWHCWKSVLYCLKFLRLTLGIGNLMSSHSLSAGHVPLGLGRDKVGIRALAQFMHYQL